jgi:cbb3-type cytochrome oxidase maturation protein
MVVIYLLIPLSIVIAVCFLMAFIWAVRSGQYEDTHTPSLRMLWDDRGPNGRKNRSAPPKESQEKPTDKE